MKIDKAVDYVLDHARRLGYSPDLLEALAPEVREMIYNLPEADEDDLDKLIDEIL